MDFTVYEKLLLKHRRFMRILCRLNIGPLVTASYLVISTVQIYFIIEVFGITIRCHQNTVQKREIKSEYDGIW